MGSVLHNDALSDLCGVCVGRRGVGWCVKRNRKVKAERLKKTVQHKVILFNAIMYNAFH